MTNIGRAIRQLREEQGLTLQELSRITGMSVQSIQRRESGSTRVKPPDRKMFAEAFGLSLVEFDKRWRASKIHQTRGGHGIPVINRAPAGRIIDYEEYGVDSGQGYEYIDYGGLPEDEHLFAVIVVGDSMVPTLHDGDRVIFKPSDRYRADRAWEDGRVCFVRLDEDSDEPGCTIARVRRAGDQNLILAKDNPAYATIVVNRERVSQLAVAVERRSAYML